MKKFKITYKWFSKKLNSFLECEIFLEESMALNFIESVPWEILSVEVVEE